MASSDSRWGWWVCAVLALAAAFSAFGWHLAQPGSAPAYTRPNPVVEIRAARLVELGDTPRSTAETLPIRLLRHPRDFGRYRLEAEFELADPAAAEIWTIYFLSFIDGGLVRINGRIIASVPTSTPETAVSHIRSYAFLIPADSLRPGANQLVMEWGTHDTLMQVARVFVGPDAVVRPDYERRLFWQNTMAQVGSDFAMVGAALFLGIYAVRRRQPKYLLMGITALSWICVCLTYFLPAMPASWLPYWHFFRLLGVALLTNSIWLFLVLEVQPKNRWFPWVVLTMAVFGPAAHLLNYWITNAIYSPVIEPAWGFLTVSLGIYPFAILLASLRRRWDWRHLVFLVATVAGVGAGVADMMIVKSGTSLFGGLGYSAQAVSPLWFVAIGMVLVRDFVNSFREQEQLNRLMTKRLAEQEAQLTSLYEVNRQQERKSAIVEERQRIMQDIHDGLGSQLISSLALSERGKLDAAQVSLLLRECIDDLRLAIDSTSDAERNFRVLTGDLRFRMQPRLRAAGIALKWDVSGLQDDTVIADFRTLPLLRILQECITNVLKHANAGEVSVRIASDEHTLTLEISDNGRGFDAERIRHGKGLLGLEKRARIVLGRLSVDSSTTAPTGTRIRLDMPLFP